MVEVRDNGDVIVIAANGDPVLKLQRSEPAIVVNELVVVGGAARNHPLDVRGVMLSRDEVEAIHGWAEAVLAA